MLRIYVGTVTEYFVYWFTAYDAALFLTAAGQEDRRPSSTEDRKDFLRYLLKLLKFLFSLFELHFYNFF